MHKEEEEEIRIWEIEAFELTMLSSSRDVETLLQLETFLLVESCPSDCKFSSHWRLSSHRRDLFH